MSSLNYDDPAVEEKWCKERRAEVAAYLKSQGIPHGRIGDWPACHIAPHVSIWVVESAKRPETIGWWVICGDLPTDYISAETIKHPREAVRFIAARWLEVAGYMSRGERHPTVNIGTPGSWPQLVPLLRSRSQFLAKWANDDFMWEE